MRRIIPIFVFMAGKLKKSDIPIRAIKKKEIRPEKNTMAVKVAALPVNVNWKMLIGVGTLGGIGFTMSIFIANLAFTDAGFIQFSKVAILASSLLAALIGLAILFTEKKIQENDNN